MGTKALRFASILLLVPVFPVAAGHDTFKQEMRFGAEAAQQGLWREAAFRWERVLKSDPDNARVHNNLAVAYETLGQFERARKEYEAARRLDPGSKEIRSNQESFLEFCKSFRVCGTEPQAPGSTAPPAEVAAPSPSPTPGDDRPPAPETPGPPPGAR